MRRTTIRRGPGRLFTWNSVSELTTTLWSAPNQVQQFGSLEIDPLAEKLYFGFDCESSNFDFSQRQAVVTPYWGCKGNAVDPLGRMFYWLDLIDETWVIRRVDLDGGTPQDLVTAVIPYTGTTPGIDIEIDPCGEKMYWTTNVESRIVRADLSGSNIETVLETPSSRLELDVGAGKMYWTNGSGTINRANLDGTDVELVYVSSNGCRDLAIDPFGGRIYCNEYGVADCETGGSDIFSIDFSGEQFEVHFVAAGDGSAMAVANDSWNGPDCSTLCIGVNDCSGNGECVAFESCVCNSGWEGADCSTFNCLEVNDCSSNGTCVGANTCDCDEGFGGANCSTLIPAVSDWGLVTMTLVVLSAGTVMLRNRKGTTQRIR